MDPVSQGALGGALSSAAAPPRALVPAAIAGAVGGMLPDLDILIRSERDPLLFLEYHRQFTHSLIIIPVGGLVAALLLLPFLRRYLSFQEITVFATLGYATHALLDACTSYGTQLFWPFSNARISWHSVSVVDPLFTVPLLALVIAAVLKRRPLLGRLAFGYALLYLAIGFAQRERAERQGLELAESRGHTPVRMSAKPSFANLLLWKIVYEHDGRYYVDAVRLGPTPSHYPGESVAALELDDARPMLPEDSTQALDIRRFRWFSDGWLAMDPGHDNVIGDVRFSMLPHQIAPLWGIRVRPATPQAHVDFVSFRDGLAEKLEVFLRMLAGRPLGEAP